MHIEKFLKTKYLIIITICCNDGITLLYKFEFLHILSIYQFAELVNIFTQSTSGPYFLTEQQAKGFLNSEKLLPHLMMLKLMEE